MEKPGEARVKRAQAGPHRHRHRAQHLQTRQLQLPEHRAGPSVGVGKQARGAALRPNWAKGGYPDKMPRIPGGANTSTCAWRPRRYRRVYAGRGRQRRRRRECGHRQLAVRRRPCAAAGSPPARGGFTLIEVLVVVVIPGGARRRVSSSSLAAAVSGQLSGRRSAHPFWSPTPASRRNYRSQRRFSRPRRLAVQRARARSAPSHRGRAAPAPLMVGLSRQAHDPRRRGTAPGGQPADAAAAHTSRPATHSFHWTAFPGTTRAGA